MTATSATAYKVLDENTQEAEVVEILEYDFDNDAGAQGDYNLGQFPHKALVTSAMVYIVTACTSAGSATVEIGASTADADGFLDATSGAVANLTIGTVHTETTATNLIVAADEYIQLTIGTADLTAGKVRVIVKWIEL